MKGGLPLFLEKPLALDNESANRLMQVARMQGFVGVVDHLHLFAPEFQEIVRQGRTRGAVRAITSVSGNCGPYRGSWSACWDWAPHDVAMALAVMDSFPVSVLARVVARRRDEGQIFENIGLTLTFSGGTTANIVTGNAFDGRRREFSVVIDDLTLSYFDDPDNKRSVVIGRGDGAQLVPVETFPPLKAALNEFVARIRQGTGGETDLALGVNVVWIISAAERSMHSGVAVPIEPPV